MGGRLGEQAGLQDVFGTFFTKGGQEGIFLLYKSNQRVTLDFTSFVKHRSSSVTNSKK